MFDTILTILLFLSGLSILVIVHELGHYLPAKWFGMRVDKFFLFFDWPAKLFSWRRGETEYGVGLLPIGGYVKIAGMVDESLDTEGMSPGHDPEPWEFRAKPVWQRAIVMVGGVTMNVILAIAIFSGLRWAVGEPRMPLGAQPYGVQVPDSTIGYAIGLRTGDKVRSFMGEPLEEFPANGQRYLLTSGGYFEVERAGQPLRLDVPASLLDRLPCEKLEPLLFIPNGGPVIAPADSQSAAWQAGLRPGDRVVAINDNPVPSFGHMRALLRPLAGQRAQLRLARGADTLALAVPVDASGRMGVALADTASLPKPEARRYNFFQAIGRGAGQAFGVVGSQITAFGKIFRGEISASRSVAGPGKIASALRASTDGAGWVGFLSFLGLLSMVLAFVNILPIPALDGGHLVFLLLEAITGREPSLRARIIAQYVGLVIVLGLMLFAIFNDIFSSC